MMENIIIENVGEKDLAAIHRIEIESFKYPYPYSYLYFLFTLLDKFFLVAREKFSNKIIGYVIGVIRYENIGHVYSIAVEKNYRGKGIGRKLMQEITARFKQNGCKAIRLEVRFSNEIAQKFYEKMGFRKICVIKEYYPDSEDCFLEILELDDI